MVRYFIVVFIILSSIFISSCGLLGIHDFLDTGYLNNEGKYVPKRPNFKFKDKKGFVFPENLDTINFYRLEETYHNGKRTFPSKQREVIFPVDTIDMIVWYKFFSNGRVLKYGKLIHYLNSDYKAQIKDLEPANAYKYYYYSKGDENIKIETFLRGDGFGRYWMQKFSLNKTGDTLILGKDDNKSIFVIDSIPFSYDNFHVDW